MPGYVLIVDFLAFIAALVGFTMAFRQSAVRRLLGRRPARPGEDEEDPLVYILRIGGIMIMVFGIAIGGMVTLFHLT